ncbi:MAG: hypothetical protein ACR2ID_02730 [Chthoniobacterales bacterium]
MLLTSCGTTSTAVATRSLPAYEPPLAQADLQTVRTTAYTHSEADHVTYGARNALGGTLQSSIARLEVTPVLEDFDAADNITLALFSHDKRKAAAKHRAKEKKIAAQKVKGRKVVKERKPQPRIGSAAADWSRWPVGTTFRVLSTGQVYKVDDYGWALAGRNTIDLYMANRSDMNSWGVRHEPIQVLQWGDRQASMALLTARQHYKHCRRMLLELEEKHEEAAALQ